MNDYIKSLIQIYKTLDESKILLEEVINHVGVDYNNFQSLPQDVHNMLEVILELSPEQRKILMRFIDSLKE